MHKTHKWLAGPALIGLALLATGCLLAGNYHSAKTLNKGESEVGLTFSATSYAVTDDEGNSARFTLPSLLPEIAFHVGMADNLEVGGRVGLFQLALEGDLKYRFLQADKLHLALAPSIGLQSMIVINGTILKLPVIATYELADNFSVTASLFGQSTYYSTLAEDDDSDLGTFGGKLGAAGASLFVELSGDTFAIRPGVEFTRYALSFGDSETFDGFSTLSVFVNLGFIRGKEKKQLDRIERKLDSVLGEPPQ